MLTHVVSFKYRDDLPDADRAAHVAALRALGGAGIAPLRSLVVGEDVLRSPRSFDTVLISTHDDREGLAAYAAHPQHQPVLALSRAVCRQIVAVDFES